MHFYCGRKYEGKKKKNVHFYYIFRYCAIFSRNLFFDSECRRVPIISSVRERLFHTRIIVPTIDFGESGCRWRIFIRTGAAEYVCRCCFEFFFLNFLLYSINVIADDGRVCPDKPTVPDDDYRNRNRSYIDTNTKLLALK